METARLPANGHGAVLLVASHPKVALAFDAFPVSHFLFGLNDIFSVFFDRCKVVLVSLEDVVDFSGKKAVSLYGEVFRVSGAVAGGVQVLLDRRPLQWRFNWL